MEKYLVVPQLVFLPNYYVRNANRLVLLNRPLNKFAKMCSHYPALAIRNPIDDIFNIESARVNNRNTSNCIVKYLYHHVAHEKLYQHYHFPINFSKYTHFWLLLPIQSYKCTLHYFNIESCQYISHPLHGGKSLLFSIVLTLKVSIKLSQIIFVMSNDVIWLQLLYCSH